MRLLAITEEMGATLRRAAYSTNIKTRGDFSCAFFDRQLRTIAQAFAQPSHLGSLAHIVPRAIAAYGPEHLEPGDGILINDPFLGGVHLNDITLISPVFHEGEIFGYLANIAHHVDVGGGAPGSIGVSNEIYQEGVVIPPIRFVKEGQIDRDIFALIRANFRGTKEISGDFRAQTAANRLGWQRLQALLEKYGAAELRALPRRHAGLYRAAHRRPLPSSPTAPSVPSRTWTATAFAMSRFSLVATVRIDQGRVSVDLTECAPQRPSPTNATSAQTYSGVVYVLKCLIDPDISVNDGFYRLVDIRSTPGTVVHAQHPAAVAAGWEVAMQLCDLLFKALASALPERVLAGTKGCICNIAFGGINPRPGTTSPSTRPSPAATAPPAATTAWMPCRRISRTPRTPPWKRPRPITRCVSCATSSSPTQKERVVIAADWACGATTRSQATPRASPSSPIKPNIRRGVCSAAGRHVRPGTSSTRIPQRHASSRRRSPCRSSRGTSSACRRLEEADVRQPLEAARRTGSHRCGPG